MGFPYTKFILQTSFKPLLLKGGRGGSRQLVDVTVNSTEENSQDFRPNPITVCPRIRPQVLCDSVNFLSFFIKNRFVGNINFGFVTD